MDKPSDLVIPEGWWLHKDETCRANIKGHDGLFDVREVILVRGERPVDKPLVRLAKFEEALKRIGARARHPMCQLGDPRHFEVDCSCAELWAEAALKTGPLPDPEVSSGG